MQHDYQINILRRKDLLNEIKQAYPDKRGAIVLFAGFESEKTPFLQESSFWYLTGINEPGVVLVMNLDGKTTLYVPNCIKERSKWVVAPLEVSPDYAKKIGVDEVKLLGSVCKGYQLHPFFPKTEYEQLLVDLQAVTQDGTLFTLCPETPYGYIEQRLILQRLTLFGFDPHIIDIAPIVARMRRSKDMKEIETLYKAVGITCLAQEAAAKLIADGASEAEVQAVLEYIITGSQAHPAFASIVGSGKHAAILHYTDNTGAMHNGDLVVVDIGAQYDHYCADVTRTYPVSGTFTKRQKEIYDLVLETQTYIAELAKPGMWLSNKDEPEQSLHHLARAFLSKKGYGQYFTHGIGHFLGLDVHDVGDHQEPLQPGDVITIEPGIYMPEERIGIRIEDDYWIVKDGNICFSEGLPKQLDEVERMVQEKFE